MKIQCNACEVAEAKVLCCADEAALCYACDEKVHAANKLASKHQRVSLCSSASQMPKCDICQETVGYFFCLEDRALLCRKCDVSIHTANIHVSAHQRFLLAGVKVALEPTEPGVSSLLLGKSHVAEKIIDAEPSTLSKRTTPALLEGQYNNVVSAQGEGVGNFASTSMLVTGGSSTGSMPRWQFDEFLGLNEFNQNYGYMDNGSSKADSGKFGDSDCSILRGIEEEQDGDELLGQVPDASWAVPQIPSPPTASGLYWPKTNQHLSDAAVFVPDICFPMQYNCQSNGSSMKRGRQF